MDAAWLDDDDARAADDTGHGCDDAGRHATTRCLPSARARALCAPVSEKTTDVFVRETGGRCVGGAITDFERATCDEN